MSPKRTNAGVSIKTLLANELLTLSEQTIDPAIRARLFEMERQVLTRDAGPETSLHLLRAREMLRTMRTFLAQANCEQCIDYLGQIDSMLGAWRQAPAEGKRKMGLKDLLSKTAREAKKRDDLIAKLDYNVFKLDQKVAAVSVQIEKRENECAQLKLKAAKLSPGCNAYTIARGQYDRLMMEIRTISIQFQAMQKALQTNKVYAETLRNTKSLEDINVLLPGSLEKMETDLLKANDWIQESMDKLIEGAEIANNIVIESDEITKTLSQGREMSDFDQAVSQIRRDDTAFKMAAGEDVSLIEALGKPDMDKVIEPPTDDLKDEVKP